MNPFSALLPHALAAIAFLGAPVPPTSPPLPQDSTAAPTITLLTAEVWPEYDDPRVLVIYRGSLDAGTVLPASLSLTIPADAQVHMAGSVNAAGEHIHGTWEARPLADGRKELAFTLDVPNFWVEFYYDPLDGAEQRAFTVPVVVPFDARKVVVSVQQPLRSEAFDVSPFTQEVREGPDGFLYHVIQRDSVKAGAELQVAVRYTKPDHEPSVPPEERADSTPWASLSGHLTVNNLLVAVAVLLAGAAAYLFFAPDPSLDREAYLAEVRRRRLGERRVCAGCGAPVAGPDRYCAECGHRVEDPLMAGSITG